MTTNSSTGLSNNLVAVLCYFLSVLGGILFLLIAPYNADKEIRFHAFQSIFLGIAFVGVQVAITVVYTIFALTPLGILVPLLVLLSPLVWLAWVGLSVYLMFTAYQGQRVVLPVIGPMAEQQA